MHNNIRTLDLFGNNQAIYEKFLPNIKHIEEKQKYKVNEWDIPYTIQDLAYLVHSHYRYYGKFPSVVAGQILEQFPPPTKDHYVIDNYCGSGTTLVEAKLRNIKSYGIDISWLSVLATNVKVRRINTAEVKKELFKLVGWFEKNKSLYSIETNRLLEKWFEDNAARDLSAIRDYIFKMPKSHLRDFLIIGFIGIVRRVSKAHDGEVRPHLDLKKKQREVIEAFAKKINDMCKDHDDYNTFIDDKTAAECYLGDNTDLKNHFNDKKCYLVISHPPYLNSFNYSNVYSLEFYWGEVFEEEFANKDSLNLHKNEMRAHPANDKTIKAYFEHLDKCYRETYRIQETGSYLAIVIGDCTKGGQLINVIQKTIEIVEKIGYQLHELNYRTTHYGLGKYAYKTRADYHGMEAEKKDGIIIFKK